MSTIDLHAATAPLFIAMLKNVSLWLDKAEAFAAAKGFDAETLLQARLAPDMLPLAGQLAMATAFPKNCMCRLAGETPPDFPDVEKTIADHRARIARSIAIVSGIGPDKLKDAATRELDIRVGPDTSMKLTGDRYVSYFVLPNFYFHVATAYDILRHNGVDLGKRDFLPTSLA